MAKKINEYQKITTGFVVQHFVRGKNGKFRCERQDFTCGDDVVREDDMGQDISDEIDETQEVYETYDMVQPDDPDKSDVDALIKAAKDVISDFDTPGCDEVIQQDEDGHYGVGCAIGRLRAALLKLGANVNDFEKWGD